MKLQGNLKVQPLIELMNIQLVRGDALVLKNLTWRIMPREQWVLLGPNGCGKSTLIALLQGHLWPQEGQVKVLGRSFGEADLTEMRRYIGWVGNDIEPEFPQYQTVEEIVLSGATGTIGLQFTAPNAADRKRAKKLLQEVHLENYAKRPFPQLSQGQKRLVTIARALMTKPGLLVLDEPTGGLDPVARELFLQRLSHLMQIPKGPAILYVTHHVEEIIPAFTHIALLNQGEVLIQGPLEKCLTAKNLSQLFNHPLKLNKQDGRYVIRL